MITGRVTADREAVVDLIVRGPTGKQRPLTFLIDTGFDSYLAVPSSVVAELELAFRNETVVVLGDGSSQRLRKFGAEVLWGGTWRDVTVLEAEGGLTAGMSLLANSRLTIEVLDGGRVFIDPLP